MTPQRRCISAASSSTGSTTTPPSLVTLAGGGWVGLQTGWFYDTVQLGAVGYTSQPLWAPQNHWETSNGTHMLRPGGYGFFALGQAYASARWQGQTFTGYRQYIDELEVNPWDNRMVPQTFEAYALRGQARRRKIFCRLRGGHEAARLLGLHQHGRSRRRARTSMPAWCSPA